jgi:23S rRNA (cytidine1920-2'-O)/16S rRNA (cytidine1409-2'-O)-methyltransferase
VIGSVRRRKIPLIELLKVTYPRKPETELAALIMRGDVQVNGKQTTKPGTRVESNALLSLRDAPPYVSRGGEKLARALEAWQVRCDGTVWIDAGCSTGGFTDCLLAHGASRVYAVDVGLNQLDWRLRWDSRVTVMEGTNIMDLKPGSFNPAPHRAVADLSFRSLRGAAFHILRLTREEWGIFLVKPQFEWARPSGEFRGVVRDPRTVVLIVRELVQKLESEGLTAEKALLSPIHGRKGNRELLFLLSANPGRTKGLSSKDLESMILEGWEQKL